LPFIDLVLGKHEQVKTDANLLQTVSCSCGFE